MDQISLKISYDIRMKSHYNTLKSAILQSLVIWMWWIRKIDAATHIMTHKTLFSMTKITITHINRNRFYLSWRLSLKYDMNIFQMSQWNLAVTVVSVSYNLCPNRLIRIAQAFYEEESWRWEVKLAFQVCFCWTSY